jgi:hypothetical protein
MQSGGKTSKTTDSKKRKLPQTTLTSFFSQDSSKKKLLNEKTNEEDLDELIDISKAIVPDGPKEEVKTGSKKGVPVSDQKQTKK